MTEELIAEPARTADSPGVLRAPSTPTLIVGPEARWFRVREHPPVLLLKAQAARLMFARFVRQHVNAVGRALSLADLFEAGWPGERIAPKAAANRVHVTLTKLLVPSPRCQTGNVLVPLRHAARLQAGSPFAGVAELRPHRGGVSRIEPRWYRDASLLVGAFSVHAPRPRRREAGRRRPVAADPIVQ